MISLWFGFDFVVSSFWFRCDFVAVSLWFRCGFGLISLWFRFDFAVISLWFFFPFSILLISRRLVLSVWYINQFSWFGQFVSAPFALVQPVRVGWFSRFSQFCGSTSSVGPAVSVQQTCQFCRAGSPVRVKTRPSWYKKPIFGQMWELQPLRTIENYWWTILVKCLTPAGQ